MAIILLFILALVAIQISTDKILAKHPLYGNTDLTISIPKKLLIAVLVFFSLACFWKSLMYWFDSMRSPSFWIPFIGDDPLYGEVIEGASENEIGIPTSRRGDDMVLMMYNVMNAYKSTIWCIIVGVVSYIVYLKGIFVRNKALLWCSFAVLGITTVFACRYSVSGIVHLVNWATSGIFNPYDGDTSNSFVIPLFSVVTAIAVVGCGLKQYTSIESFITFDINTTHTPPLQTSTTEPSISNHYIFENDGRSKAEKLFAIKELLDGGILSEDEFICMKQQILNSK